MNSFAHNHEPFSDEVRVKRMVPLLGTFVRIELYSETHPEQFLLELLALMFQEISFIESLMSYYQPNSDVSRINRSNPGDWCKIHPATAKVLQYSERLRIDSEGIYNVGFHEAWSGPFIEINTNEPEHPLARKVQKGEIDLGGVAKGFAIDQAYSKVKLLHSKLEVFGSINAGGDLFLFESRPVPLAIQVPLVNELIDHRILTLQNGALATSTAIHHPELRLSYRTKNKSCLSTQKTVSIFANTAMEADSLTKVVLVAETIAEQAIIKKCLLLHHAQGFHETDSKL